MPKGISFPLICFWLIVISSCHTKRSDTTATTPAFDSVLASGDRIYDSGFKKKAIDYVVSERSKFKNLTIEDELSYYTYCNTIYVKDFNDYDRSIALGDSMLTLLAKEGLMDKMPVRRIQAYNIEASALLAKGRYRDAFNNFFNAKKLAASTGDTCSLSEYSYSLGMVLYRQQKFAEAALYFLQSYDEAMRCENDFTYFYRRQELLDNIGLCYSKRGRYDSAILYFERDLAYIDQNRGKFANKEERVYDAATAVVWGNIADIYVAKADYNTADSILVKSISVNLQKGFANWDALITQAKLADLYLDQRQPANALPLLKNIEQELDTIRNGAVALQLNKMMWRYYSQQNDSVAALRYLQKYVRQSDSTQKVSREILESNIDASVDNTEHQYKLYLLQNEAMQQRTYLVIAIIVVIMAIVIVAMMVRYSARAEKNVKALTELNNKINESNQRLEAAFRELEAKNKDNSRILRSVAHDVMSPIAAIAALTDILITESEEHSDEHKEIYQLIREACNNSLSLSKDILEAAATIAPGVLSKEWINVNKLIAGTVELQGFRATEKKQHIVVHELANDIEAYVNKEKIWRVINNLITNAIKFSHEGGTIDIYLSRQDGNVLVKVADHGLGIPERHKANLFDMFTESKMTGTAGEKPNGLGLSISLQIARAHGGNIWFESVEGQGSTFYFTFPVNNR